MSDDVFHKILKKAARFGAPKNYARFDEIVVRLITGCARAPLGGRPPIPLCSNATSSTHHYYAAEQR